MKYEYEIIDHGIENSQYFQGCGVSLTEYDFCVTGVGDNFAEAIEDCLEQLAMMYPEDEINVDTLEKQIKKDEEWKDWPKSDSVSDSHKNDEVYDVFDDSYYHVSIRLKDPSIKEEKNEENDN